MVEPTPDAPPATGVIEGWVSTNAQSLLQAISPAAFSLQPHQMGAATIEVIETRSFQPIEGFGFALTGGSASLIANLPPSTRSMLLDELFGTGDASIGLSCIRVSIGASDMGRVSFSYCDLPTGETDPDLTRFNITAGDPEIVPILQEILQLNPSLKIIAAPWSAPPWMKDNGRFVAGRLRPDCYQSYANYFVKYIDATRSRGIHISAVSPQNEPRNPKNDPSMLMSGAEQIDFIKNYLGPALREKAPGTEILCWDHNCDEPEYPLEVLADPTAQAFIAGVAWHLYAGSPEAMLDVFRQHQDKKVYFTEQWISVDDPFEEALRWHIKNVVIGALRNNSRTVLEWNLASDQTCSLHTPGGAIGSLGGITIGPDVRRNAGYYLMAHSAKFIRPGSVRIASSEPDHLHNVACRTTDNHIVLIVVNDGGDAECFNVLFRGAYAQLELEPGAVATYRWALTSAVS